MRPSVGPPASRLGYAPAPGPAQVRAHVPAVVLVALLSLSPRASAEPPPAEPAAAAAPRKSPPPVPSFDNISFAKLRAGIVLSEASEDGNAAGAVRGWSICRCAPDAAWAVLTDHASFPQWMPRMKAVEVSRRTAAGERALQTIDVSISTVKYALDYSWDPATRRIDFHLVQDVPHDLAAVTGGWQLWPLDQGKATLLEYQSQVDVGRAIPGFIRSYLADRGVKDTLEAVRKRAEAVERGEVK